MSLVDKLKKNSKNIMLASVLGIGGLLFNGCFTHPQPKPVAFYRIDVIPDDVNMRSDQVTSPTIFVGDGETFKNGAKKYVNEQEIKEGIVRFGKITISRDGYKSHVIETEPLSLPLDWKRSIIEYFHRGIVELEKDPSYEGPTGENANKVNIQINSEPRGARIYIDGKFFGSIPEDTRMEYVLRKALEPSHYKEGRMELSPITVIKDGYLPLTQQFKLEIDPDWRYKMRKEFKFGTLFLLQSDPNYRPPPQPIVIQQPAQSRPTSTHLTIEKEKDALDFLQQIGEIGIMIKSLKFTE